jgi:hypothetical protein
VHFECSAYDPDGEIITYLLDPVRAGSLYIIPNNTGIFDYTYNNAGIFNARCKAEDNEGASTESELIQITIP